MHQPAAVVAIVLAAGSHAAGAEPVQPTAQTCTTARQQAHVDYAISILNPTGERISETAVPSSEACARADGEIGRRLYRASRYQDARGWLRLAYNFYSTAARAGYALDLGNVEALIGDEEKSTKYYNEAVRLARNDPLTRIGAKLNLARNGLNAVRYDQLVAVAHELPLVQDAYGRARLHLNLASIAMTLDALGPKPVELAYSHLIEADQLASIAGKPRLRLEIKDSLAQLYENQGRRDESLLLTRQALADAKSLQSHDVRELQVHLEWRQGRLLRQLPAHEEEAVAAYLRAVDDMESVRQDVPIIRTDIALEPIEIRAGEDRSSSYETLIKPLYLQTIDLLLLQPSAETDAARKARLHRVRDTLELLRQSEMQDYLGDRCTVDAIRGNSAAQPLPQGTAVLYPIVLSDRVELLLEMTGERIDHASTPERISGGNLQRLAASFSAALRSQENDTYRAKGEELYKLLVSPFADVLKQQHIDTLVLAVDGSLRSVPFGALHDGQGFLIERFAIAVVTGMSMTNTAVPSTRSHSALIAGLAHPAQEVAGTSSSRSARPLRNVVTEVQGLRRRLGGVSLLDTDFTEDKFFVEAGSGEFRIVHIASHGQFGKDSATSYVMAHDGKITMEKLKVLLESDALRRSPIEMLSLSACETAEGDAKSPLGLAGAAMKARAHSVLGTLWSVDDKVAEQVMNDFYESWIEHRTSRASALQCAQIALLQTGVFSHPYFWAPFVLVGNWK